MAQLLQSLDELSDDLRGFAVSIGNFDGVHKGHAELIAALVDEAARLSAPALVLTFSPPPRHLLFPDLPQTRPLTTLQRRAELLGNLGVDAMLAYPTDLELLHLQAKEFFDLTLVAELQACAVVEGPNFRFGHQRRGDTALLKKLCAAADMNMTVVAAHEDSSGRMISSSRIRELLLKGQVVEANRLLTQPFSLQGEVEQGGASWSRVRIPDCKFGRRRFDAARGGRLFRKDYSGGEDFPVAVNIGSNPTFGEQTTKVELHIIGWEGNLYGQSLTCVLLDRLREIRKFDSAEALREQLEEDVSECARRYETLSAAS